MSRSPLAVVENGDLIVEEEVAVVEPRFEPRTVGKLDRLRIPVNVQHHPQRAVGIHPCVSFNVQLVRPSRDISTASEELGCPL